MTLPSCHRPPLPTVHSLPPSTLPSFPSVLIINPLFAFAAVDWFRQLAQYDNLGLLGRGNYAEVYKGRRKVDGKLIAIKNIKVKSPTACTSTHTRASRKFARVYIIAKLCVGIACLPPIIHMLATYLPQRCVSLAHDLR